MIYSLLAAFVAVFLLFPQTAAAQQYGQCTPWIKEYGHTCILNGKRAQIWRRQCFHLLDVTVTCMNRNPNEMKSSCTRWFEADDFRTCYTGRRWEKRWIRICHDPLQRTEFCSDHIDPNRPNGG